MQCFGAGGSLAGHWLAEELGCAVELAHGEENGERVNWLALRDKSGAVERRGCSWSLFGGECVFLLIGVCCSSLLLRSVRF